MHILPFLNVAGHSIIILLIVLATSCGKGFKDLSTEAQEIQLEESQYHVNFQPLNKSVGNFSGNGSIVISSDNQFWARIKITGSRKTSNSFTQYMHVNGPCPDSSDDSNGDGYLDIMEVAAVTGQVLIPFDGNLNSQYKGISDFPHMRLQNNFYYYSETTSGDHMMKDLKQQDTIDNDLLTKLAGNEGLSLSSRVIIIYGIDSSYPLPSTVSSFGGAPVQDLLPIACGEVQVGESNAFGFD